MKLNDAQAAMLTIQLSTLGQVFLADNDQETLQILEYLLEQALINVRKTIDDIKKES